LARHVAVKGESRYAYRVLVGGSDGKISLGRPKRIVWGIILK